jgi:hypothetical protein
MRVHVLVLTMDINQVLGDVVVQILPDLALSIEGQLVYVSFGDCKQAGRAWVG